MIRQKYNNDEIIKLTEVLTQELKMAHLSEKQLIDIREILQSAITNIDYLLERKIGEYI